jgi:thiol:disulfide interchange protein DsbD
MKKTPKKLVVLFILVSFICCKNDQQISFDAYVKAGFATEIQHEIINFTDYEKGLEYAKKVNKPVLLNFKSSYSNGSNTMEQRVWTKGNILSIIKNEVVLISLYTDSKKELPKSEQYTSKITGNMIRTIGDKWMEFQLTHYQTNAEPLYIIQGTEGNNLGNPQIYTPDPVEYEKWLQAGIDMFKK